MHCFLLMFIIGLGFSYGHLLDDSTKAKKPAHLSSGADGGNTDSVIIENFEEESGNNDLEYANFLPGKHKKDKLKSRGHVEKNDTPQRTHRAEENLELIKLKRQALKRGRTNSLDAMALFQRLFVDGLCFADIETYIEPLLFSISDERS